MVDLHFPGPSLRSCRVGEAAERYNRRENDLAIRFLQAVDVCFARIFHQVIVRSPPRLPKSGAAILVCNHTSYLDPMLIQSVCPRIIRWMMAAEYYDVIGMRWIFKTVGVIPVERSGKDLAATRAAMRALADGYVLGVFPEGKLETSRELLPFQSGVGMMAVKTGVPVIPAYLDGTQRGDEMAGTFLVPQKATLRFGPVMRFDSSGGDRGRMDAATSQIQSAIQSLKDADQRR